jgi:hypothetical protein
LGWTDDEIGMEWFEKTFLPFAKSQREDDSKPMVLFVDGHLSHVSLGIQRIVYGLEDCTVIIVCFPSKCTHKMQPLDVVVFNPVQREWKTHCDN